MPSDTGGAPGRQQTLRIALTGATGFVGKQFLSDCAVAGISVSALTRQNQPETPGIRWVRGDLFDEDALSELVRGADCVIHLAGATKALSLSEFGRINTQATERFARICTQQGIGHFVFMSSLAATRPTVSPYARSKAEAEQALAELNTDMKITTVRAPAVLGPGDAATHPLFANLAKGRLLVPGGAARGYRFSVIDVFDLSHLLLDLANEGVDGPDLVTPYSHKSLDWQEMADAARRILGRPVRQIVLPWRIMVLAAHVTDIVSKITRKPQVFSREKLREMQAGDWIATTPVQNPVPLGITLTRCLAPLRKTD